MLAGDIARAYTQADNSTTVSTDTIKNVVNVVAREELEAGPEAFCRAVAKRLLNSYPGMTSATVSAREVRWNRVTVDGTPTRMPSRWMATARARPKW
jgi:urate oxidase